MYDSCARVCGYLLEVGVVGLIPGDLMDGALVPFSDGLSIVAAALLLRVNDDER